MSRNECLGMAGYNPNRGEVDVLWDIMRLFRGFSVCFCLPKSVEKKFGTLKNPPVFYGLYLIS